MAPEQVENIDEIMIQFEGKELELIEQLRLMKPRGSDLEVKSPIQDIAIKESYPFDLESIIEEDANSSVSSGTIIWTTSKNVFNRNFISQPTPSEASVTSSRPSRRTNDIDLTRDSDYIDVVPSSVAEYDENLEKEFFERATDLEVGTHPQERVSFAARLSTAPSPSPKKD